MGTDCLPMQLPRPRPECPEFPFVGQMVYQDLVIDVETAGGGTRSGVDPNGKPWSVVLPWPYGEFRGTKACDGDAVDVFVGPDPHAAYAWVVQAKKPGTQAFDEPKVMLGFASRDAVLAAFRAAYSGPGFILGITRWPMSALKAALNRPDLQRGRLGPQALQTVMRKGSAMGRRPVVMLKGAAPRPGLVLRPSRKNPHVKRWMTTEQAVAEQRAARVEAQGAAASPAGPPQRAPRPGARASAPSAPAPRPAVRTGPPATSGPFQEPLFAPDELALPKDVKQRVDDPAEMFRQARVAHQQQVHALTAVAKELGASVIRGDQDYDWHQLDGDLRKPGPVVLVGPPKAQARSEQKVKADYNGDWSRLTDAVRSTIAVDQIEDVPRALDMLRDHGIKIAKRPKDRFTEPTEAGYRDALVNVVWPNGHIGEIQLHVKPILRVKEAGHKLYEPVRSIEAALALEEREMTPDEIDVVRDANSRAKLLYDGAWKEVLEQQKPTGQKMEKAETAAAETRYFDLEGRPARVVGGNVPLVCQPDGTERRTYELEKFYHRAQPISAARYNEMKAEDRSTGA